MKIYFNNKEIDILVDTSSYRYLGIQNAHSLNLYFSSEEYIDIPVGAYCIYQGYTFYLMDPNDFKKNSSREYAYTLVMYDIGSTLGKYKCRDIVSKRLKFDYTAKPKEHLQMLVDNMNMRDTGWSVGECIEADEKLIAYNHTFCDEALRSIADTFKTEWEIDGKTKTIHLRKVEYNKDAPLPLEYGKDKGFKPGLGRSNSENSRPVSILYVQGGSQNIDPTKYKSSELLLPKSQRLVYEGRTYVTDTDGLYIKRSDKILSTVQEDSLDCSNIYPKRVGKVSDVIVSDADKNFYDFIDNSIPDDLNFEDYLIAGETMTVIFQDKMLAGKEFEVKYVHKERKFQITPQEIDGQVMPNEIYKPILENKYAVFGIQLPEAYICNNSTKEGASWDMFREAARYLYENEDPKFTFKGEMDGIWSKKRWLSIGGKIRLGGYILFKDPQFIPEGIKIRITSIKEYVHRPYSPIIELSNVTVGTSVSSELNKIEENEVITDKNFKESIQFTKRRFRDAKETIAMLNEALLHFSGSISPISVQTMSLLVGDESLQFRFVNNKTNPVQVEHLVTYDNTQKILTAPGGILQHMTLGIDSVSSSHKVSEYKFWNMERYISPVLTETVGYYLYAKVSKSDSTGSFLLSKNAIKLEGESGYYHLLVGVLNSEFEEERSFVELYGFTEILPGRITTDRVVSSDGQNFLDFVNNAFRVGNDANFLDFNTKGDGKLRLKGSIVQSESGDESPIGCFRGVYNNSYTYYWGDEVIYDDGTGISMYRFVSKDPIKGVSPKNSSYWIIVAQRGVGISDTDVLYAISSSNTTAPTSGWQTTAPAWKNGSYIWSKTKVVYTDGSIVYTDAACITGGKGETGNGISSITEQYYLSSSTTSLSGGNWSNSRPIWKDGWYIWTRSVINYTNGNSITTDAICVTGGKGETGDDGINGDYFEYRFAVNGSRTSPPALSTNHRIPSGWTTSVPEVGSLKYLWLTIAKINGTNNTLLQYWSTPVRQTPYDGVDGKIGATMVYRGIYDSSKVYYGTDKRVDAVKFNGHYYVSRVDAGNGFQNHTPTDTAYWNDFGAEFESIATNLLLAEGANIGDWFMSGGKIVSTLSDGNKIILDASMARIMIESKRISGDYTSGGEWSSFTYPSLWKQYGQSLTNSEEEGYEYIYYRTTNSSRPSTPSGKNVSRYLPDGWSYYSQGVNSTYQYEWMSRRYQKGLYSKIELNAGNGLIEARNDVGVSYMTPGGIFSNWANTDAVSATLGITRKAAIVGLGFGNLDKSQWDNENFIAGVYGTASNKGTAPSYGGFFQNLMAAGLLLNVKAIDDNSGSTYLTEYQSFVLGLTNKGVTRTVYLPNDGIVGRFVFAKQIGVGQLRFYPRSGQYIHDDSSANDYYDIPEGWMGIFVFTRFMFNGVLRQCWTVSRLRY